MMTLARTLGLLGALGLVTIAAGPAFTQASGVPLPVRKVMLYKNGMGYFEHLGEVRGADPVEITFSSAQLNDVLKSLTVLDLAPAPVASVTYDSTKPTDRQLAELPIKLGSFVSVAGFLNEIRGTELELDVPGGPVRGRLLTADVRKREVSSGGTAEAVEVTILAAGGELRTVDLAAAKSVRLRGSELTAGLDRYLEILDTARRQDVRRLRIQTTGAGMRKLFVAYTSEAPVWKTTYRLVLDERRKPLLQGWAIVDNTTATDWNDVELALVAGAPISFVQRLSEPVYAHRPEVPVIDGVAPAPQTHAYGAAAGERLSQGFSEPRPERQHLFVQEEAPVAVGRAVGEQFEYRIPHPVTLLRNHSAMLPIVHAEVDGEKVAVWTPEAGDASPRSAIWLTNGSGLTLAPGAFTVIDAGGFAGEGLTETIHPRERRLLSYGRDLAVRVTPRLLRQGERVERVVVRDGVIRWHTRRESEVAYRVTSQHAGPRTVILDHPVVPEYALAPAQTPAPVESTPAAYRFRVAVGPRSTTELTVRTQKPEQSVLNIDGRLTRDQLALWLRERRIDAAMEQAIARVITALEEAQRLTSRGATLDGEVKRIFADQERVRENLGKLGQGPDEAALRLRYVQQLEQQEKRLEALRAEMAQVEAAEAEARRRIGQLLKDLVIDRTL